MTNQIQGEILFQGIDKTASEYVRSPWLPVHGDKGTFGIEILKITGSTEITWGVETRTVEDPTVSVLIADSDHITSGVKTGFTSSTNAKELVRYRIATGATPDVAKYAILRVLQPSWQGDGR